MVLHSSETSFAVRRSMLTAELADVLMTPDVIELSTTGDAMPKPHGDLEVRAVMVKHAEFRHMATLFCAEVRVVCATVIEAITKRWPENALLGMARQLQKVAALFFEREGLAVVRG